MASTASVPSQLPSAENAPLKSALISVSDKNGIAKFALQLAERGVNLLSTGGTAKMLKDDGLDVTDVSDHTGFPEIMDGRVKTLHPKIHGGILARRSDEAHQNAMSEHDITPIDMVVINLYPFIETVRSGADFQTCIENIDIGGPAMIRAAAKNHEDVVILTNPEDYEAVLADMDTLQGGVSLELRRKLAMRAYAMTAKYDAAIAAWFENQLGETPDHNFAQNISFNGTLKQILRYGENPHQTAALYLNKENRPGAALATQVQGKELSYNNLNDTDAAFELVAEFDPARPAVAIIKHANPCGVATGENVVEAYNRALACDPTSAFGGIIALNQTLTADLANEIVKRFVEVVIAPDIEAAAMDVLKAKDKIRVLTTGGLPDVETHRRFVKCIAGGLLVQDSDNGVITPNDLKIVTDREPTQQEMDDLLFAFKVCKHVKSNAIIYAKDGATVGIGAGQMSRIDSSRIAAWKAEEAAKELGLDASLAKGAVVASDAFFPFADGLIAAAEAGVTAIIQPGGSIRDEEVIAAANERGLAMAFTGMRHFRH